MGKRKVTILEPAVNAIAELSFFLETEGLPATAKKFVDAVFVFLDGLADEKLVHRPCFHPRWLGLGYRCATFRKKYTIAYINKKTEVVICEFVLSKLLK